MSETIIEADALVRRFGDLSAVDGATFRIGKGELFGLLGENGAGKSTLLKLLTGQLEPTSGRCTVLGVDPAQDPMKVKSLIGILPEVESPPSFLTGREYLHFIGLVRHIDDIESRADKWIDFLNGLRGEGAVQGPVQGDPAEADVRRRPHSRTTIHFLDEPFSGLDPRYQKLCREYLSGYIERGGTVFMCTHILEIAEKMCSRVGIISQGHLVAIGKLEDILRAGEGLDGRSCA